MLKSKRLVSMLLAVVMMLSLGCVGVFAESTESDSGANDVTVEKIEIDMRDAVEHPSPRISQYVPEKHLDVTSSFRDRFWNPVEGTWFSDFYFDGGARGKLNLSSASFSITNPNNSITLYVHDFKNPNTYQSVSLKANSAGNVIFDINITTSPNQQVYLRWVSNKGDKMSGAYDIVKIP